MVGTVVDSPVADESGIVSQVRSGDTVDAEVEWGRRGVRSEEDRSEEAERVELDNWLVHEYVSLVDHRCPGLEVSWEGTLGSLAECKDPTPPYRLAPWFGRWATRDERPNLNGVGIRVRKK